MAIVNIRKTPPEIPKRTEETFEEELFSTPILATKDKHLYSCKYLCRLAQPPLHL